jgi:hypothetical protein
MQTPIPASSELCIDADFDGGNIILERIDGSHVYVRQDIRDTNGDWFFWRFRVRGAEGRRLMFHFTAGPVIGTRGPAVSRDGGRSWEWLGAGAVSGNERFVYASAADEHETQFCFCVPYLQEDLERWLDRCGAQARPVRTILTRSRKGRAVELLRAGAAGETAEGRIVFTARHHCCESTASFVLEGVMEAVLSRDDAQGWQRSSIEFLLVPFVDKDGVEQGDQGKNRIPHDHGRDYAGESLYPECGAIREMLAPGSAPPCIALFDIHCPHICGPHNEVIYQVGAQDPDDWRMQQEFGAVLRDCLRGPLRYDPSDDIPYGVDWNSNANYTVGMGIRRWASKLPGMRLATCFEIPYANVGEQTMTPDGARAFGADIASALSQLL